MAKEQKKRRKSVTELREANGRTRVRASAAEANAVLTTVETKVNDSNFLLALLPVFPLVAST